MTKSSPAPAAAPLDGSVWDRSGSVELGMCRMASSTSARASWQACRTDVAVRVIVTASRPVSVGAAAAANPASRSTSSGPDRTSSSSVAL